MALSTSRLAEHEIMVELERLLGKEHLSFQDSTRIAYSRDMWPRSLLRQRLGAIDRPPWVVTWPADPEEVGKIVRLAYENRIPVIPFGAGSGVCGGTLPVQGGIVIDLKRMNRIVSVSDQDLLADVQAGMVGEMLERELNRRGWTLGHFPSSIYCSTVGGWLAGRSAGQCSSLYGKIEDMCRSLTWVDYRGEIHETSFDRWSEQSWSLNPLLIGSEGTLGIICSSRLVIRPLSQSPWYGAYRFSSVEDGTSAMRQLLRSGLRPSVLRLYDEFDTLIAKTGSTADLPEQQLKDGLVSELLGTLNKPLRMALRGSIKRILQAPRLLNKMTDFLPSACLMVVVYEGSESDMELLGELTDGISTDCGASILGPAPARYWWEHRYGISYKQSTIFSAGGFVDTMEVSCTWDRLMGMYHSVKKALSGMVFTMAHFSHAYRDGCSIYFTFAGASRNDVQALDLYDRIWDTAQDAVRESGGTVSHHHGVGLSKARFLLRQLGPARKVMNATKSAFDPRALLNPGKLGQDAGEKFVPVRVSANESALVDGLMRELGAPKVLEPSEAGAPSWMPGVLKVLRPSDARDVAKCLRIAGEHGAKVVVLGKGTRIKKDLVRSMKGACLLLSTSGLTGVELSSESLWARAGAGTSLSHLYQQARAAGLRPVGMAEDSQGTVGGWLSEITKVPDAILGIPQPATSCMEAVLASGRLIRSSHTPREAVGPDIFSIMLGAGGAFGVISLACLKLEPLPETALALSASFSSVTKALSLSRECMLGLLRPSDLKILIEGRPGRRTAHVSLLLEGRAELVSQAFDGVSSLAGKLGASVKRIDGVESSPHFDSIDGRHFLLGPVAWSGVRTILRGVDRRLSPYEMAVMDRAGFTGCRLGVVVPSGNDREHDAIWQDLLDPGGKRRESREQERGFMGRLREKIDPGGLLNPHAWQPSSLEPEY